MPKIIREDKDDLNAVLTITLEKSDYEQQFEEELQKYRKQVAIKGFRKGKTPASMLRKMYGKSVLADVINHKLNDELFGYIANEKLDILGQPLSSKDQAFIDFDARELKDYEFKFDLGLAPQFELQGVSADDKFSWYAVEIPDSMAEEDLLSLRKRVGERLQVEGTIQEGDFVKFDAKELAGDALKEGGFETNFGIMVNEIENEAFKAELFTKKVGDTLRTNVYQLFNEPDDHYIRHHLLKLDHDDHDTQIGQDFELTITEATRTELAPLDQDFFDKAFGKDKVHSEEEAKAEIRKDIEQFYEKQADALWFRDFQEYLMEKNQISLPDGFLKRWIKTANAKLDEATIERDYENFSKNLQWTLLKNKLAKKFEIQIEEAEIREAFAKRVLEYFGAYGSPELINSTVDRLMQDEKQVNEIYEDLLMGKLQEAAKGIVTIEPKPIDQESFTKVLEEARVKARAEQQSPVMALEEEE